MHMSIIERLRFSRQAAELVGAALKVTDKVERERLLAEARVITERLDQQGELS